MTNNFGFAEQSNIFTPTSQKKIIAGNGASTGRVVAPSVTSSS